MNNTTKQKICLVPHFHYDVAYDKTYEAYLEIALTDMIEMFNIMDRYKEYRFLLEQVIMLKEFWERFPEYRSRLKRLVEEGRVEIGPGMFVMPDMNLISGESLIRQSEVGRKWLIKIWDSPDSTTSFHSVRKSGTVPITCWIADCWGHHAQIPQILKKCGYRYYAFSRAMRLDKTEKSEFFWEGLDGTKILTHWMPIGYNAIVFSGFTFLPSSEEDALRGIRGLSRDEFDLKRLSDVTQKLAEFSSGDVILLPNGSDFTRPQAGALLLMREWKKRNPDKEMRFSLASEVFGIWEKNRDGIPTVSCDFNPAFQGTYCSRIDIKQANRFLENQIDMAERLLSLIFLRDTSALCYKLEEAIEIMLYNQFHDIICGSIIDESYEDTVKKYKRSKGLVSEIIERCLDEFMATNSKHENNLDLLVFNPLGWVRKDIALAMISFSQDGIKGIKMKDKNGKEVPTQIVARKEVLRKDTLYYTEFTFVIPVDISLGYTTYKVKLLEKENKTSHTLLKANKDMIENKVYRLKISNSGNIKSLIHKESGEEFIDSTKPYFNDLIFQIDQGDFWEYYEAPLDENMRTTRTYPDPYPLGEQVRDRRAVFSHQSPQKVEIIEKGPVRLTVKVEGKVNFWASTWEYVQYIYLYDSIRRIDFRTEFVPSGKHYRLRIAFPTNIKNGIIRYEIPFGIQERPEGEYPALNWVDYQDDKKGICLINRGLPGNNVTDGVMMLSLFRAVDMGPGKEKCETGYGEGRKHVFEYSIVPFIKKDEPYLPWRYGYEFNQPVVTRMGKLKKNSYLEEGSILINPVNVVISSIKRFKDGILIRLYEAEGRKTEFEIRFPDGFLNIYETNCLGENQVKHKSSKGILKGTIAPFEIRTFYLLR
ncbi:MAG: hypothetical protein HY606_12305 [Planctomycetes bacterium]|nr:hypothetical protein [Planctomycetota bacterium]